MLSGINGLAIASFDALLSAPPPCAHKSGDGVSALRPTRDGKLVDADECGLVGRNSDAFALSKRGDERGEAGRLVARNDWCDTATWG